MNASSFIIITVLVYGFRGFTSTVKKYRLQKDVRNGVGIVVIFYIRVGVDIQKNAVYLHADYGCV